MLYLKKFSPEDADKKEIYELLQGIDKDDNGFHNNAYGIGFEEFQVWFNNEYEVDNGKLESFMVPQTSYWLYDDETPVGYGRLRHYLNESLAATSGHIGYAIAKPYRGRGFGRKILSLLMEEASALGIRELQVGANKNNLLSNRVILSNGGILFKETKDKSFYHIDLSTLLA